MGDSPSLKYGRVERERRFLLARVPDALEAERELTIRDRYLSGTRLRLRLVEETGQAPVWKLGQKVRLSGVTPELLAHTTMYLNEVEAAVLGALPGAELTKTRQILSTESRLLFVDAFHDHLDGLVLAEVDLGQAGEMPRNLPIEALAEVTSDERFTGGALAVAGASALSATLMAYGVRT
jgi:CYTH domain-containing protein